MNPNISTTTHRNVGVCRLTPTYRRLQVNFVREQKNKNDRVIKRYQNPFIKRFFQFQFICRFYLQAVLADARYRFDRICQADNSRDVT